MTMRTSAVRGVIGLVLLAAAVHPRAQTAAPAAATIQSTIDSLRSLPDDIRARTTADLASRIRALPAGQERLRLAISLANLSTEGDFGRETLQAVTTTLATAVDQNWSGDPEAGKMAVAAYVELAQLARYEHMTVGVDRPEYRSAAAALNALDALRAKADFTLTDLAGRTWTRTALTGHVVLVNFWATWCPPCRKEMPDLDSLAHEFAAKGLIVLAISDEPDKTVRDFLAQHPVTYPILLDPGRVVSDALKIDSIPKTFIYDRTGRMVAQSIDMRTRAQFLRLLAQAGLT